VKDPINSDAHRNFIPFERSFECSTMGKNERERGAIQDFPVPPHYIDDFKIEIETTGKGTKEPTRFEIESKESGCESKENIYT
jgi:hypothetical protein